MFGSALLAQPARERIAMAVRAIEAKCAAEVVVAVRRRSGFYRHTDYLVGFASSMAALAALLFLPQPFAVETMPIDVVAAFILGAVVSAHVPPLRRALTSRELMDDAVEEAARAAFVALGVSKTRGRTGVIVFASVFERRIEIVADLAANPERLGDACERAARALRHAIDHGVDVDRFLEALGAFGAELAEELPRAADDVNELPDEVRVEGESDAAPTTEAVA
jgi:putative membrane protein